MTTTAKDFAAKAFVAVVATAMVFSLVAPAAKAATAEELQAQITALMAQITALQGGTTTTTTTTTSTAAYTFTRSLTIGSEGADVTALQNYLISKGFAIAAGATGYFGAQTASAVAAWQTANMISPAAGYFGPVSQAKYMALMAATPTTPTTGDDEDDEDDTTSADLQGEASLDKFEADDANDDTIEEGVEDAVIGMFTVEFADGDAEITRMDIAITNASTTLAANQWDAFDTVSLWVDDKKVAEVDASSKSDYLGDEEGGVLRFSDLSLVAMEDEKVEITIGATIQNSLDTQELSTWEVRTESVRFFDADGVATTEDQGGTSPIQASDKASFTIEVAGADDEVIVRENDDSPKAMTLEVKDDAKSDEYTIFTFDIDTDDSTNDITLNEVVVNVLTTVEGFSDLVNTNDVDLIIDGETIDDVTVSGVTTLAGTAILTFDVDGDITINAGDRVAAELKLAFKSLAPANEGATFVASVNGSSIKAEGSDDFVGSGSDTGEKMTIRTSGLSLEQTDTTSDVVNNDQNINNSYGKFTSDVEVTVVGDNDLYVGKATARGASSTAAIAYNIVDDAGAIISTGTSSASFERVSGGSVSGNFTKIAGNGGSATFKLNITSFNPTVSGNYKVQILSVGFAESAINATDVEVATPDYDFDTEASEFIQS